MLLLHYLSRLIVPNCSHFFSFFSMGIFPHSVFPTSRYTAWYWILVLFYLFFSLSIPSIPFLFLPFLPLLFPSWTVKFYRHDIGQGEVRACARKKGKPHCPAQGSSEEPHAVVGVGRAHTGVCDIKWVKEKGLPWWVWHRITWRSSQWVRWWLEVVKCGLCTE